MLNNCSGAMIIDLHHDDILPLFVTWRCYIVSGVRSRLATSGRIEQEITKGAIAC
ncbi:MAG: hypothetical protein N2235_19105 [Fischerella sp.]|nr:hypothetical protein [Fischerella sp.]